VHCFRTQYSTNKSQNLPSYLPDNHHLSDAVYCRGMGFKTGTKQMKIQNRKLTLPLKSAAINCLSSEVEHNA